MRWFTKRANDGAAPATGRLSMGASPLDWGPIRSSKRSQGRIRKILTHLGEPLEPPPISPARGPPADWGELVQIHDDRAIFQASPDELPAIDIHSL